MNKAVPWNVNGVGFDAREAAREAARRQGKSLGEWLHGVIADHAADLGVEEHEVAGQQRIDAVTSKLERLSARSADHDRRLRAGRVSDTTRRRTSRDHEEAIDDRDEPVRPEKPFNSTEPRRRRETPAIETTELLLEEAIDAMERRALRAERHTENALQSFGKLLERNEANREREREAVTALAQKLSDIDARLVDRLGQTDESPIKGALARLEARLDAIGRRGAAESSARQQVDATPARPAALPDSFQRLEEKLNSIYDAIHTGPARPMASPLALAAAQVGRDAAEPTTRGKDRRLGEAIANIAKRQQVLQGGEAEVASLPDAIRRRAILSGQIQAGVVAGEAAPFAAMQNEIAALASKIEDLRRDVTAERPSRAPAPAPVDLDSLRTEIASMSEAMRDFMPVSGLSSIESSLRSLTERIDGFRDTDRTETIRASHDSAGGTEIVRIHEQMQEIRDLIAVNSAKLDQAVEILPRESYPTPTPAGAADDRQALERLIRGLSQRIDAVQGPDAGQPALDALQRQVALLATRFERSDDGLAKLTSLERSMRELFTHLDETRASVETSAARTAREVLRIAMEEGRTQTDQGTATSLAAMQALQDEAEARTSSTLNAVHGTLEKVVDRLSAMESDIAETRKKAPGRPPELRIPELRAPEPRPHHNDIPLRAPEPLLTQALGVKPNDKAANAPKTNGRGTQPDLEDENGRADFIAAARRAAKVAQSDPSLADLKRPGVPKPSSAVRAGLIEQTRDYVTRHKRPVLLSIAALFVILGTMAIIQRIGLDESESQSADATAPTHIASTTLPAPKSRAVRQSDELTPSALPTSTPALANPIPGSDPIQTSSIPSLPAFAASTGSRPAPRQAPTLPANLKTMAESGDGAAEYVLGAQYAEGNLVPRDFALAAKWYQKAAAQNLAPAQYRLASLYEKGLGVTQDKAKAKTLYLQAAEAGNPRAMHNLAVLLADGDGKPDYDGAATWFRKAAQYGIHDSQYNLAILLARGIGVQQSLVQSYQWFAIAAAQGDTDAAKKRDEVGARLGANDLAVAKALANSYHPRIADAAATEVQPPPGGWDGASAPSPLNSARPKISSL